MSPAEAAVLGAVQGLTEFLPVSSSAHLILVPYLLGWPEHSQTFDVALHAGTALALLWFFRRDWLGLVLGLVGGLVAPGRRSDPRWRLALLVAVGSAPAGVAGALLEETFERMRAPAVIGLLLILFALLMLVADRLGRRTRGLEEVGWGDAVAVGLAQAVALVPGVSRSGVTMTVGLARGMTREAAARFSFLLSGPIVVAAAAYKLRHGVPGDEAAAFLVGVVTSGLVGWAAIGLLLRYLQRQPLTPFVWERVVVGAVVLVVAVA